MRCVARVGSAKGNGNDVMAKDWLRYDKMVENALRGVVREALTEAAVSGLPGEHHFYITFRTDEPQTRIPQHLKAQYPREMTIVLQHQFWGLEITDDAFTVTLSFGGKHEALFIPFETIVSFADPSVKFALQFDSTESESDESEELIDHDKVEIPVEKSDESAASSNSSTANPDGDTSATSSHSGTVVALDAFRKKH